MSPHDKIRAITSEAVLLATEPEQIFGEFKLPKSHWLDDLEFLFRALVRVWHLDRAQDPFRAKDGDFPVSMQALLELRGRVEQKIAAGTGFARFSDCNQGEAIK
jgi:hypothetical protein